MADAHDGGSPGSGTPAYMYEDRKKMVYADDPEAVRHVGDWLGSRGRLISDFAVTVHRELSKVDDLYSSAEGAPAQKAQLYVESLNTYMYNLSDALALVDPNKDIGQPGNPPGDGSNPPTQPGASSLPGSGAVAPGRIGAGKIEAGPGTILPPGPTLG